ncbi:MAG: PEP-CTERM sorting domain-containing protein [Armatimonadota bacterium]|nr:PEP-CTERM sorting domain-containing protein [Armatimonadota bacterium]
MKITFAAATVALTSIAGAQIYTNGTPDLENGNEMTAWLQAENFNLGAPNAIGMIKFWTIEVPGVVFEGNVDWWIFMDNAGTPGAIHMSGTSNSVNRAATGNIALGFYEEFVYEVTIAPAAVLGSTNYWLGLHLNSDYLAEGMYWETTNNGNAPFGMESSGGTMNNWFSNGEEHVFELYAVPEPSTFLVLGGLAGLLLARRRRR